MNHKNLFLALSLYLFHSFSFCSPNYSQEPIHISASKQHVFLKEKRAIFIGEVQVIQGTIQISADQLLVEQEEIAHAEPHKTFIATGSPAKYTQDINGKPAVATANRIEYKVHQNLIYLYGEAQVKQDDSLVKSDVIKYDTISQEITAEGNSEHLDRVITIYQPENSTVAPL